MKKLILMMLLTCASNFLLAQLSAQLGAGVSIPIGEYSHKKDIESDGFANKGNTYNFKLAYAFNKRIGTSLLLGSAGHQVDENAVSEVTRIYRPDISISHFRLNYLLIAPTFTKSIQNSELKFHLHFGAMVLIEPKRFYQGLEVGSQDKSQLGLAVGLGMDYTYYIFNGFGIFTGIDLFGGEVAFNDFESKVSVFNLNVGLKNLINR